jgi:hypothetical protein
MSAASDLQKSGDTCRSAGSQNMLLLAAENNAKMSSSVMYTELTAPHNMDVMGACSSLLHRQLLETKISLTGRRAVSHPPTRTCDQSLDMQQLHALRYACTIEAMDALEANGYILRRPIFKS